MDGRKNILIVISSLKLGWWAEKIASTIGNELLKSWKYNIKYLTFYDAEQKYPFKGKEFCLNETISNNFFIKIIKFFKRAYLIKKYCKENNIDISLSHMEEANFSNVLSKSLFNNKSKICLNSHISVDDWGILFQKMIKYLYNKSDKVITVSKEAATIFENKYNINQSKLITIYNAINIEEIKELSEKEIPTKFKKLFNRDKLTFISIWRLTYQKNQELLIDSFKMLNNKYKNIQLIILWDWDLKQNLQQKIWKCLDIHLLWNQKNPYNFLKQSDVFVLSSRYEWFWIVIIEWMACGLPIISTDCKCWPKEIIKSQICDFNSVPDLSLEDFGLLVPLNNKEMFFKAMEKLYLDKWLRESLSKKSLQRARDFDVENIIKQWEKVLYSFE